MTAPEFGTAPPGRYPNLKLLVAGVYVLAVFLNLIDATIVNVALPTIASAFGLPVEQTAAVNVSYLVAAAVTIPAAGWLGDRFGIRETFLAAIGLFTAASVASGFAGSFTELVGFRVAQGLAAGVMMPVGMAMMYRTFVPADRARMSRMINIPIAMAPACGPVLGGLLVQQAGWRWIFWINLPIGMLAVALTLLRVRPFDRYDVSKPDVAGILLVGAGFAGVLYALSQGGSKGWLAPDVLVAGLAGLVALGAGLVVELTVSSPMLELRLLANRLFRSANLMTICSSASFVAALFVFTVMVQDAFHRSPLATGLITFPEAAGVLVGTQVAGHIYARVGPRRLLAAGQLAVAVVLVLLATTTRPTGSALPIVLMTSLGAGQAFSFLPVQAAALDTVPPRSISRASALFSATRQAGSALGVALAATVIAVSFGSPETPTTDGPFRVALLVCAAWSLIGFVIAVTAIHDSDAAPSRGLTAGGI